MNYSKQYDELKLYWLFFLVPCGIVFTSLIYFVLNISGINGFFENKPEKT